METRQVILRSVSEEDFPTLFRWRNSEKYRSLVHYNTTLVEGFAQFVQEFQRDIKARTWQFIIEHKEIGKPIGLIFTHTYSPHNQYCFVNLYLDQPYEKKGLGVQAFALLLRHLFEVAHIHKVYFETFEYNKLSLASLKSCGFSLEGTFKEHKFFEGKRYDVYRFAAFKENLGRFQAILQRFETEHTQT